jgi:hypothetical protein
MVQCGQAWATPAAASKSCATTVPSSLRSSAARSGPNAASNSDCAAAQRLTAPRHALSFEEEREIAPFFAAKASYTSASALNPSRSSRIGATILD